ncbi:MAG: hypothetical protein IKE52_01050 [Mogibacterium sp.]|nr:hypothetical protein [Mogibacterium sp.]
MENERSVLAVGRVEWCLVREGIFWLVFWWVEWGIFVDFGGSVDENGKKITRARKTRG